MKNAKFVKEVTVIDPDSKGEVQLAVYKHENGGMFAIDSSFIDQVVDADDFDRPMICDPLGNIPEDAFKYNDGDSLVLLFED